MTSDEEGRDPTPLDHGVIRLLLRLFPPEFRSAYGAELSDFLNLQRHEQRYRGLLGRVRFWRDILVDALMSGFRLRRSSMRHGKHNYTGESNVNRPRTVTGAALLVSVGSDLRYALRSLLRAPRFTTVAILTLGIGIGTNAAVFPFLYGILVRPLPFDQPDRLAVLFENAPAFTRVSASYPNFNDWRRLNTTFTDMAAYGNATKSLTGGDEPERLAGATVSHNLFDVLGILPLLGRSFLPDDDVPDARPTVILSYGLWQRRFGADRQLLGGTVTLDGESHVVIGVMPVGFRFPGAAEFWVPLRMGPNLHRRSGYLTAIGRLTPGVTVERAQLEMTGIARQLEQAYPETNAERGVVVRSLENDLVRGRRTPVLVFYSAACLVLLLACANVANLMLARVIARRGEMAMRSALGAGRLRLIRQLLTESALLAAVSGAAGILVGRWIRDLVVWSLPPRFPYYFRFDMSISVVLVLMGITLLSATLFGMAPALAVTKSSVFDALRGAGTGASCGALRSRTRSALVVSEITIAFVVLICAGLMVKGFRRLTAIESGFDQENVLTLQVSLPRQRYADERMQLEFFQSARDRMRRLPGVTAVSSVSNLPMTGSHQRTSIYVEGSAVPDPGQEDFALNRQVQPGYFDLMGIPVLQGRDFDPGTVTADGSPVVIVDESFARRYWPHTSAIGKRVKYGVADSPWPWMAVVGVVGDTRHFALDVPIEQGMYRPLVQEPMRSQTLLIKTVSDPRQLMDRVRQEIWSLDPNLPVYDIQTMDQVLGATYRDRAAQMWLLSAFSAVALLLAALGVYGVVSYSVAQRTREFGVRMALGAPRQRIANLVVSQVARLAGIGLVCGLPIALVVMRFASSMLFDVGPGDLTTYGIAAVLMSGVAATAAAVPARRAARLDPLAALRLE
jgi:putative ABC transport system permease protein